MSNELSGEEANDAGMNVSALAISLRAGCPNAAGELLVALEPLLDIYASIFVEELKKYGKFNGEKCDVIGALYVELCESITRLKNNDRAANEVEQFIRDSLYRVIKREAGELGCEFSIPVPRNTNHNRAKREDEPYQGLERVENTVQVVDRNGEIEVIDLLDESDYAGPLIQDQAGEYYLPSRFVQGQNRKPEASFEVRERYSESEMDRKIAQALIDGYSCPEIAELLGCTNYRLGETKAKYRAMANNLGKGPAHNVHEASEQESSGTLDVQVMLDITPERDDVSYALAT